MFYCGFCGRNQKASYPGDIQEDSFEMFKKIFDKMPKNSTISITLDTYSHSIPSLQRDAADTFAREMHQIDSSPER